MDLQVGGLGYAAALRDRLSISDETQAYSPETGGRSFEENQQVFADAKNQKFGLLPESEKGLISVCLSAKRQMRWLEKGRPKKMRPCWGVGNV